MDVTGWTVFAGICKEAFGECGFQEHLIGECGGHSDIAWAAFFHLRDDSIPWLHRHVPNLDGAKPADLIRSGNADAVRGCLWSFPC